MMFSTALSGLNAASTAMRVEAHNIANLNTDNFKKDRTVFTSELSGVSASVEKTDSPVNLEESIVNIMEYSVQYMANAQVIKTQNKMLGSLLDTFA